MLLTASSKNLAGVTVTQDVLGLVSVKLDGPLMVAAVAFAVVRHFEGIEKSFG